MRPRERTHKPGSATVGPVVGRLRRLVAALQAFGLEAVEDLLHGRRRVACRRVARRRDGDVHRCRDGVGRRRRMRGLDGLLCELDLDLPRDDALRDVCSLRLAFVCGVCAILLEVGVEGLPALLQVVWLTGGVDGLGLEAARGDAHRRVLRVAGQRRGHAAHRQHELVDDVARALADGVRGQRRSGFSDQSDPIRLCSRDGARRRPRGVEVEVQLEAGDANVQRLAREGEERLPGDGDAVRAGAH
mmetsp:Transcript_18813/g.63566  ORF Transcript_18813/g.63566 Transcript_18813/m.63566 type:complete len:245 (-) Transcript_18813:388-1122(-)